MPGFEKANQPTEEEILEEMRELLMNTISCSCPECGSPCQSDAIYEKDSIEPSALLLKCSECGENFNVEMKDNEWIIRGSNLKYIPGAVGNAYTKLQRFDESAYDNEEDMYIDKIELMGEVLGNFAETGMREEHDTMMDAILNELKTAVSKGHDSLRDAYVTYLGMKAIEGVDVGTDLSENLKQAYAEAEKSGPKGKLALLTICSKLHGSGIIVGNGMDSLYIELKDFDASKLSETGIFEPSAFLGSMGLVAESLEKYDDAKEFYKKELNSLKDLGKTMEKNEDLLYSMYESYFCNIGMNPDYADVLFGELVAFTESYKDVDSFPYLNALVKRYEYMSINMPESANPVDLDIVIDIAKESDNPEELLAASQAYYYRSANAESPVDDLEKAFNIIMKIDSEELDLYDLFMGITASYLFMIKDTDPKKYNEVIEQLEYEGISESDIESWCKDIENENPEYFG